MIEVQSGPCACATDVSGFLSTPATSSHNGRIAAPEHDFPIAGGGRKVAIGLGNLDDMAESIFGTRVGRVFLAGSGIDDLAAYEALEGMGLAIVGEDHEWGDDGSEYPRATRDPLDGIVDRYHFGHGGAARVQKRDELRLDKLHAARLARHRDGARGPVTDCVGAILAQVPPLPPQGHLAAEHRCDDCLPLPHVAERHGARRGHVPRGDAVDAVGW